MSAQLLILDFGSQYTQLIARTVRELGVYCEILPGTSKAEKVLQSSPKALILSGGPSSVNTDVSLSIDPEILKAGLPTLGICYGMQLLVSECGGKIEGWARSASGVDVVSGDAEKDESREFGPAVIQPKITDAPFSAFSSEEKRKVWMSHGDKVVSLPEDFEIAASTESSPIAAFSSGSRKLYGVQFHPEVQHTPAGKEIIESFIFDISGLSKDWIIEDFIEKTVSEIKEKVPSGKVVCGLSGGVDSTVAAKLVHLAVGSRLHCIFVDNGLLRKDEAEEVVEDMNSLGLPIKKVDASQKFLSELQGVTDPEQKRKIIGRVFIEVFEEEATSLSDAEYLVQGTLYPDVIESESVIGKSAVIKSHHNVGGLTDNMKLKLIEPLRELFKDEVRSIGDKLNMPSRLVMRQPFPGPGLAIRCLGELSDTRLKTLSFADAIVREEVAKAGLESEIWQYFAVLLPVKSVGVMGDGRTYEETIAIRAITSRDGMTADWFYFPEDMIRKMSSRIVNETEGVNRVVLDISTKPPATIEWE